MVIVIIVDVDCVCVLLDVIDVFVVGARVYDGVTMTDACWAAFRECYDVVL